MLPIRSRLWTKFLVGLLPLFPFSLAGSLLRKRVPPVTWPDPALQIGRYLPDGGRCTVDVVAPLIDFQQLANLVYYLAEKKRLSTSDVLSQVITNLGRKDTVKRPVSWFGQEIGNPSRMPSQPPQPPPPPPPPRREPPSDSRRRTDQTRSYLLPPISVQPPPDATLSIHSDLSSAPLLPPVSFPVVPMMTVSEALYQAQQRYRVTHPDSSPFHIQVKVSSEHSCEVVGSIGSLRNTASGAWDIVILDKFNKIRRKGFCIPGPEQLLVHPGTRIQLVYTSFV